MLLLGHHFKIQTPQFKAPFIISLLLSSVNFGMAGCKHSLMFLHNSKIEDNTKHKKYCASSFTLTS